MTPCPKFGFGVPYHALHVPQHVAVSRFEPLNIMISSALSTETVFAYLDQIYPDTQVIILELPFPRLIAGHS